MPGSSRRTRSYNSSAVTWPFWPRKMATMRSRLEDRLPPTGRSPARSKGSLVDRKRLAAAAGRFGVRVLDGEAPAGDGVHEVDLGAAQVANADRIDQQLHPIRLVHLITGALAVLLDHQAILEARAAAALHEHPQGAASLVFFSQKLVDLDRSRFRDVDHLQFLLRNSDIIPFTVHGLRQASSRRQVRPIRPG